MIIIYIHIQINMCVYFKNTTYTYIIHNLKHFIFETHETLYLGKFGTYNFFILYMIAY